MIFQLLKTANTIQYVQFYTGWKQGLLGCMTPGDQGWYNIDVHTEHAHDIRKISHVTYPRFRSNLV